MERREAQFAMFSTRNFESARFGEAGITPLQIVIVLDRSHEHYFKFARDSLFQTQKAIDKSISENRKLRQYGAKNVIKVTFT